MITAAQLRAARALIAWSQDQLAGRAGVSKATVARLELSGGVAGGYAATRAKIVLAFENAGVIFVPEDDEGAGVRLRKSAAGRGTRVADAKQRVEQRAEERTTPDPTGGMAILRRGHAQNALRVLTEKKHRPGPPKKH